MSQYLKKIEKTLIFEPGSMPYKSCHASNICQFQDGRLGAVWFAGEVEGARDVSIWYSTRADGTWSHPVKVAHDVDEAHWNPVLCQKADGEVLLFYKVGNRISEWRTCVRHSEDFGQSFGGAAELVPGDRGGRGPVRCKVIALSDGSLLAGNSVEKGIWTAYADRSGDGGRTWTLGNPVGIEMSDGGEKTGEQKGVIQPTLWESKPGTVHMLLRSTEGEIYRSDSEDYGRSWGKAYTTGLPNPNSGIDVVRFPDGLLILCMNPVKKNWGPRTPLVLLASTDNGSTWEEEAVLEDSSGEYSYPSIISVKDQVYVTYTYDRQSIAFWQFERKEMKK